MRVHAMIGAVRRAGRFERNAQKTGAWVSSLRERRKRHIRLHSVREEPAALETAAVRDSQMRTCCPLAPGQVDCEELFILAIFSRPNIFSAVNALWARQSSLR